MKKYALTDTRVKRVLFVLNQRYADRETNEFRGSKSLREVTTAYNKYYPPGIFGKIVGTHLSEIEIQAILNFLIAEDLVVRELLSFTDRYLKTPELHYRQSPAGIQHMRKNK